MGGYVMYYVNIKDSYRNDRLYAGNRYKFGVTIDGINYIVKQSKKNDCSVYSEYIASNFIEKIGIACQKVKLGKYKNELVDVILDFCTGNTTLREFGEIHQTSIYSDVIYKE